MRLFNILARLLDYPTDELMENLSAVVEALEGDPIVTEQERTTVREFVSWMRLHNPLGMQEVYVQTFDMTPEHDLHLTHHLFGENNDRGPALIDLSEHYKQSGLEVKKGEIPDFLPLILEYVSTLDEVQARFFLADAAKVLKVLAENLEKGNSPYARLVRIVENRGYLAQAA